MTDTRAAEPELRPARMSDGAEVWRLVRESKVLDLNSSYAYLLTCEMFGASSVVAEADGRLYGFITAFQPPLRPDVVFVWQVAVDPAMRGRGLALRMLNHILDRPQLGGVRYLETTVTPSNEPSRRLFRALARERGTECEVRPFFEPSMFPEGGHEAEELFRIGPFEPRASEKE